MTSLIDFLSALQISQAGIRLQIRNVEADISQLTVNLKHVTFANTLLEYFRYRHGRMSQRVSLLM